MRQPIKAPKLAIIGGFLALLMVAAAACDDPQSTATSEPTNTFIPTSTHTPTPTERPPLTPTGTPMPTNTPAVDPTAPPTAERKPTPTVMPTATPTPTQTPSPTPTATATPTPEPPRIPTSESTAAPDREILVEFYHATGGPNWEDNTNWLSAAPIGQWYGVSPDPNGRVVELVLAENRLSGDIPPELRYPQKVCKQSGGVPSV